LKLPFRHLVFEKTRASMLDIRVSLHVNLDAYIKSTKIPRVTRQFIGVEPHLYIYIELNRGFLKARGPASLSETPCLINRSTYCLRQGQYIIKINLYL
jgi:hypothetical protein